MIGVHAGGGGEVVEHVEAVEGLWVLAQEVRDGALERSGILGAHRPVTGGEGLRQREHLAPACLQLAQLGRRHHHGRRLALLLGGREFLVIPVIVGVVVEIRQLRLHPGGQFVHLLRRRAHGPQVLAQGVSCIVRGRLGGHRVGRQRAPGHFRQPLHQRRLAASATRVLEHRSGVLGSPCQPLQFLVPVLPAVPPQAPPPDLRARRDRVQPAVQGQQQDLQPTDGRRVGLHAARRLEGLPRRIRITDLLQRESGARPRRGQQRRARRRVDHPRGERVRRLGLVEGVVGLRQEFEGNGVGGIPAVREAALEHRLQQVGRLVEVPGLGRASRQLQQRAHRHQALGQQVVDGLLGQRQQHEVPDQHRRQRRQRRGGRAAPLVLEPRPARARVVATGTGQRPRPVAVAGQGRRVPQRIRHQRRHGAARGHVRMNRRRVAQELVQVRQRPGPQPLRVLVLQHLAHPGGEELRHIDRPVGGDTGHGTSSG